MYLAPLNYDRFFKKVFSDTWISKRFLEDFFEIEIEEIELLDIENRLTDDASLVKFDFRCKANGEYFIIDMQQWYKQDIIQRFYTYHTLNTVLQLESLPTSSFTPIKKTVKDYSGLAPVKTLIWMVNDKLGFEDDFISFTSLPSDMEDFLNHPAWETQDWNTIKLLRAHLIKILGNDNKNLGFLRKNQLIFAFQENIVKNKKLKEYVKWFEFAKKTKDPENTFNDFDNYAKDEVFIEIMQRLNQNKLNEEDYSYLRYYYEFEDKKNIWAKESKKESMYLVAKSLLLKNIDIQIIAEATGLSLEEIEKLRHE